MTGASPSGGQPSENPAESYSQGFRMDAPRAEDLVKIVDAALDYRGDVSLELHGGEEVAGYIFNRVIDREAAPPGDSYLELFPRGEDERRKVLYRDIRGVVFSGRDTASGKSWETWVRNWETKRAARARGEDVGRIEIRAESLDEEI